jgi:hypothetical protein
VQRCERLVGVARQFEVYCAGYHGPRRTGILGLTQIPGAIYNLDNVMLPYLISTIDHLGSFVSRPRTCGRAVFEDPFGSNLRRDASSVGHWATLSDAVSAYPAQPRSGRGSALQIDVVANQQAELRGTAVGPLRLAGGGEKVR